MASICQRSLGQSFIVNIIILLLFNCENVSTSGKVRSVFPGDLVKFTCEKTASPTPIPTRLRSSCTWAFLSGDSPNVNDTVSKISEEDCFKTSNGSVRTVDIYEGYLEVPSKADAIWCMDTGDMNHHRQPLSVQNVTMADPISSYDTDSSTLQIVLQRFSDDYSVRFGAHDVTNQTVAINAAETDRIKLLCIHNSKVAWENISLPLQRLMDDLKTRDNEWARGRPGKSGEKWDAYLDFLRESDLQTITTEFYKSQEIYTAPLVIRHMTNETSRTYVCNSTSTRQASHVILDVQEPRNVGPDEIQLVQQIITILDSLAKGQGTGKEPWYTLLSMLSIVLMLFAYYCKKKMDQPPQAETQPPTTNPPAPEENEMSRLTVPSTPAQSRKKPEPTEAPVSPKGGQDSDTPALLEVTTVNEVDVLKKESG